MQPRIRACALMLAAAGCSSDDTSIERAVWTAVLDDVNEDGALVAMHDQTVDLGSGVEDETGAYILIEWPEVDVATWDDLLARSAEPVDVPGNLETDLDYWLVSEGEIAIWFDRQDGWTSFYADNPHTNGIASLSRPGFSDDGDQALLYMDFVSDWLAGWGAIYLLETDGADGWTVVRSLVIWVS